MGSALDWRLYVKIILIKTMRLSKTKQLSGTEVVALRNGWVYLAREDSSFDGMDAGSMVESYLAVL